MNELEQRTVARICAEFAPADQPMVMEYLRSYSGPETERVHWDVLQLSNGDATKLKYYVEIAAKDYRDVIYWAEYFTNDPMLRGRDPKQLVEGMADKWGTPAPPKQ